MTKQDRITELRKQIADIENTTGIYAGGIYTNAEAEQLIDIRLAEIAELAESDKPVRIVRNRNNVTIIQKIDAGEQTHTRYFSTAEEADRYEAELYEQTEIRLQPIGAALAEANRRVS